MKRLFLIGAIALMTSCGSTQNTTAIKNLKEQQKVLDLTAKLNKTQLDYEKEKVDYNELTEKAANVNADANMATTDFTATSPSSTVKDAKDTIKKLKEATNKQGRTLTFVRPLFFIPSITFRTYQRT